jgi:hypothetical protein
MWFRSIPKRHACRFTESAMHCALVTNASHTTDVCSLNFGQEPRHAAARGLAGVTAKIFQLGLDDGLPP